MREVGNTNNSIKTGDVFGWHIKHTYTLTLAYETVFQKKTFARHIFYFIIL